MSKNTRKRRHVKPEPPKPTPLRGLTHEKLLSITRDMASLVGLSGWRIRGRFAKVGELGPNGAASCYVSYKTKTASIKLLPAHLYEEGEMPEPAEQIILHELLHVHFHEPAHDDDRAEATPAMEQSVDTLAWAFFRTRFPDWHDGWANALTV
jgi:hypothetical protein